MTPRYVRISGDEPGVRLDLLRGRRMYSARFLSAEEYLLDGRVAHVWAAVWCFLIAVPLFIRKKGRRYTWNAFAWLGIAYTLAIVVDWYLRSRGQR